MDATDFSEIATTCTEGRCVLDLCVDGADAYVGVVSVEPNELMSSSARVYEVGRRRIQVCNSPLQLRFRVSKGGTLTTAGAVCGWEVPLKMIGYWPSGWQ